MTVETVDAGVIRLGNGVTTEFSFSFQARVATEIKVETVTDIVTVPVDPNDYVVAIEPDGVGGTVTFLVAPVDGTTLYIYRETPLTQLVSVASQQRYDPEVAERVWDKLTFLAQELDAELDRTVKMAPGEDPDTLIASLLAAEEDARLAAEEANDAAAAAAASAAEALAKENSMLRARGAWLTATVYAPSDIVRSGTAQYICLLDHTSGVFATDLAALKWEVWLQDGAAGAGTGDMNNSDNLSGLTDKPLALSTIGGQAASSKLTELAAPTYVRGDLIVRDATALTRLAKGTALQVLGGDGTDSGWVSRQETQRDTKPGSGTSQTFSGIPAGLEELTLLCRNVSLTGGATVGLRLGTGGGLVASGYTGIIRSTANGALPSVVGFSTSFPIGNILGAGGVFNSTVTLKRVITGSHVWAYSYIGYRTDDNAMLDAYGSLNLGAELTQLQVLGGTFDAGNFYLKW